MTFVRERRRESETRFQCSHLRAATLIFRDQLVSVRTCTCTK